MNSTICLVHRVIYGLVPSPTPPPTPTHPTHCVVDNLEKLEACMIWSTPTQPPTQPPTQLSYRAL